MSSSTSNSSVPLSTGGKAYFIGLVGLTLGFLVCAMTLVWVVDPLQLFRVAKFYPAVISMDERTQNAGVLRNYPGDSLIIGSSLSQSCRADDFEAALGGKFERLSAAGLSAKELNFYLEQRLKRFPTRRVYHISYWFTFARQGAEEYRSDFSGFPEHFYTFGLWDRTKYLANVDNMTRSLEIMFERFGWTHIERIAFMDRNSGETDPNRVPGRASVAKSYKVIAKRPGPSQSYLSAERTFEAYYVPVIAGHPDTEFNIIMPPATLSYYKAYETSGVYRRNTILLFRRMLLELAETYPNVILHDFSADKATITNYDLFFDTHHFTNAICASIATQLAAEPGGTDSATILENEKRIKKWSHDSPAP